MSSDQILGPIWEWLNAARRHPGGCPRTGYRAFGPKAPRHCWENIETYTYRYSMRWTGSLGSLQRCFWCRMLRSQHRNDTGSGAGNGPMQLVRRYWTLAEWQAFYDKIDQVHHWAHTLRRPVRDFKLRPLEVPA